MADEVSRQDQALTRGAGMVSAARSELDQQLSALRGTLSGIGAQWRGQGATSFQTTMTRWDESARRIIAALDGFEQNLRSSEQTYTTTDEAQAQSFTTFQGRME
ncbi:MAG: WXG100 family type VII secretion target [Kineosporiaceae bacterium]